MKAFDDAGLEPKIILSAIDADVCKTYVEMGLGIAILTTITYDPARDKGIEARDASHLFPASTINIALRSNTYLRPFLLDFIKTGGTASDGQCGARGAARHGDHRNDERLARPPSPCRTALRGSPLAS